MQYNDMQRQMIYIPNYNQDHESLYLMYWDANSLNGQCLTNFLLITLNEKKIHQTLMKSL